MRRKKYGLAGGEERGRGIGRCREAMVVEEVQEEEEEEEARKGH